MAPKERGFEAASCLEAPTTPLTVRVCFIVQRARPAATQTIEPTLALPSRSPETQNCQVEKPTAVIFKSPAGP
jgi:hypothetical protein